MVAETMIGNLTKSEWLERLGIPDASDEKLAAIAALTWGGNALKFLRVNAAENNWEFASGPAYRGALVKKAADQTALDATTALYVSWDSEVYDTTAFHDNVTNNSRLTVPAGVSRVRVSTHLAFANMAADTVHVVEIHKNGSGTYDGAGHNRGDITNTGPRTRAETAVISVVAGDYFETRLQVIGDASVDIVAALSWFQIEVLE